MARRYAAHADALGTDAHTLNASIQGLEATTSPLVRHRQRYALPSAEP